MVLLSSVNHGNRSYETNATRNLTSGCGLLGLALYLVISKPICLISSHLIHPCNQYAVCRRSQQPGERIFQVYQSQDYTWLPDYSQQKKSCIEFLGMKYRSSYLHETSSCFVNTRTYKWSVCLCFLVWSAILKCVKYQSIKKLFGLRYVVK